MGGRSNSLVPRWDESLREKLRQPMPRSGSGFTRGFAKDICFPAASQRLLDTILLVALREIQQGRGYTPAENLSPQEQSSTDCPETAMEFARHAVRGMMYADDVRIVSRLSTG